MLSRSKVGLKDFKTPKSDWMKRLEKQVQKYELSLYYSHVASNSHYFKIEANSNCAIGKTHHSREKNRNKQHINLNSVEEADWRDHPQRIPDNIETNYEPVDIFGIVIDHHNSDNYQQDQDDFLVLTEEILEEMPKSGKKGFRITTSGYRHPFDKHLNSWDRLFQNIQ